MSSSPKPSVAPHRFATLASLVTFVLLAPGCERKAKVAVSDETKYPLATSTLEKLGAEAKKLRTEAAELRAKGQAKEADEKLKAADKADLTNKKAGLLIESALVNAFGTPGVPAASQVSFLDPERLHRGRQVYLKNCAYCHGYYGQGDGPTAQFLNPRPRDFSRIGWVKFKSTIGDIHYPSVEDDLERTIHDGIQQTAMPAFGYPYGPYQMHVDVEGKSAPNQGVKDVAQYVALLLMRARYEEVLLSVWLNDGELPADAVKDNLEGVIGDWTKAQKKENRLQPKVARPQYDPAKKDEYAKVLEEGKKTFLSGRAQCATCHGEQARGNGTSMNDEKNRRDDWGNEISARDLTSGVYRGGRRPIDLYRRVHGGIKGTPMPGFGGVLKDEEIWPLVEYVRSLGTDENAQPPILKPLQPTGAAVQASHGPK